MSKRSARWAYSPDGKLLASASDDATVRLWHTSTQKQAALLTGHTGSVECIGFSPDGAVLALGGGDNTVRLWDLTWTARRVTGTERTALEGHTDGGVRCLAFSPDGKTLASGGWDRTVHLWSHTGKALHVVAGSQGAVLALAFAPDGKVLAAGKYDGGINLQKAGRRPTKDIGAGEGALLTGHRRGLFSQKPHALRGLRACHPTWMAAPAHLVPASLAAFFRALSQHFRSSSPVAAAIRWHDYSGGRRPFLISRLPSVLQREVPPCPSHTKS
jgi:hypothetical protein